MKDNNFFTEESEPDCQVDIYEEETVCEDYDSIKRKYVRWQRLLGVTIIFIALSNIVFYAAALFKIAQVSSNWLAVFPAILHIAILAFNVFLIYVGIQRIRKSNSVV